MSAIKYILEDSVKEADLETISKTAADILGTHRSNLKHKLEFFQDDNFYIAKHNIRSVVLDLLNKGIYPNTKLKFEADFCDLKGYGYQRFKMWMDKDNSTFTEKDVYPLLCYNEENFFLTVKGHPDKIFMMEFSDGYLREWFPNIKEYLHYLFTMEMVHQGKVTWDELKRRSAELESPNHDVGELNHMQRVYEG